MTDRNTALLEAAQNVINCWDGGDLAAAVRQLAWVVNAVTQTETADATEDGADRRDWQRSLTNGEHSLGFSEWLDTQ